MSCGCERQNRGGSPHQMPTPTEKPPSAPADSAAIISNMRSKLSIENKNHNLGLNRASRGSKSASVETRTNSRVIADLSRITSNRYLPQPFVGPRLPPCRRASARRSGALVGSRKLSGICVNRQEVFWFQLGVIVQDLLRRRALRQPPQDFLNGDSWPLTHAFPKRTLGSTVTRASSGFSAEVMTVPESLFYTESRFALCLTSTSNSATTATSSKVRESLWTR
jgi:hypothetical protein